MVRQQPDDDTAIETRVEQVERQVTELHTVIFGPSGDPLPTGIRGMLSRALDRLDHTERQRGLDREAQIERERTILEEVRKLNADIELLRNSAQFQRGGWHVVKEVGTALAILFSGVSGAVAVVSLILHLAGKL